MELHELSKSEFKVPWTLFAGDFVNVAVAGEDINFTCPGTMKLTRLQASANSITTDSQFVIELIRNSAGTPSVLATLTSAVPYVAGVVVDSGALDVTLHAEEPLALRIRGTDVGDGDDIGGLFVLATVNPVLPEGDE